VTKIHDISSSPTTELCYQCHHCGDGKWSPGGPSALGKHLAQHGEAQTFPAYRLVDAEGYELDWDGKRETARTGRSEWSPVKARTDGLDGWVRSRRSIVHHKDAKS